MRMSGGTFTIPAGHPALPGHFPGRPVVPGVVLLDHVVGLIAAGLPDGAGLRFARFGRVKFQAPVLPDQPVAVRVEPGRAPPDGRTFSFTCLTGDRTVATGTAEFLAAGTDPAP